MRFSSACCDQAVPDPANTYAAPVYEFLEISADDSGEP
jgi:hypothetical protein